MLKMLLLGALLSTFALDLQAQSQTAFNRLADGFDFPIGKPDGRGYYKARGFLPNKHQGEDWDGLGGGNTDLHDPVYSIGDGVVVYARDVHLGWGNVVIVRHVFREGGTLKNIDALYGHLNRIFVRAGQKVMRGQQLATIGTAHGVYSAHLHFEIRKNIAIGMNRAAFARNLSNYHDPSKFLLSHRHLQRARRTYPIAMNTFMHDAKYNVAGLPNFRRHSRSTSQSAAALKRALASRR
jgi:murein DD-endopeptidase MepM/ murein hydrolase activator NlpD